MQYPILWMLGLRLNLYIRELTIAHFAERASFHLRMGLDGIGFLMHDVVTFRAKMCADCMFLMSLNAHAAVGLHKTPFQLQSNQNEPLFIWFEWRIRSWKFTTWYNITIVERNGDKCFSPMLLLYVVDQSFVIFNWKLANCTRITNSKAVDPLPKTIWRRRHWRRFTFCCRCKIIRSLIR